MMQKLFWMCAIVTWNALDCNGQLPLNPQKHVLINRIVNGYVPDDPYEIGKYVVSIRSPEDSSTFGRTHRCGGTIISTRTVLTAARCLYNYHRSHAIFRSDVMVVAGSVNKFVKTPHTRIYWAFRLYPHKKFKGSGELFDIGVIRTKVAMQIIPGFTEIVPLATKLPPKDTICTTVGWGQLFDDGPRSNELMYANLKLLGKKQCAEEFLTVNECHMICAESKADMEDTCVGDSGGPLMCDGKQVGVVSFGFACGIGLPSVFTDIPVFLKWIDEHSAPSPPIRELY